MSAQHADAAEHADPAHRAGRAGSVPGRLVGVGVGPGDPELVTVKAVRALRGADVVFVPVSDGHGPYGPARPAPAGAGATGTAGDAEAGRAEAIVLAHLDPASPPPRRLPFRMTGAADYAGPAATVAAALDAHPGGTVAFATIGDPNVYSTFTALAAAVRALRPDTTVTTVPGITAMQDLAARSGTVLAVGAETVALLPLTAGLDAYRRAVSDHDTVVAYKGGRALPDVLAVLAAAGRDGVYGAALGLPGEDIRPTGDLPAAAAGPYLSTVISTRRRIGGPDHPAGGSP
jgi:precorrin-2/cobalt-factor-2 C20-methyltransferase